MERIELNEPSKVRNRLSVFNDKFVKYNVYFNVTDNVRDKIDLFAISGEYRSRDKLRKDEKNRH